MCDMLAGLLGACLEAQGVLVEAASETVILQELGQVTH